MPHLRRINEPFSSLPNLPRQNLTFGAGEFYFMGLAFR
jgi:hypothetical protein